MNGLPLLADAGVGPLVIPILGGLGIAGLFLAAAAVFGGLWIVHGSSAPKARRRFLMVTAVGCWGAAVPIAFLGTPRLFEYWIGAAVLAVVGLIALLKLRAGKELPAGDPVNPD